MTPTIETETLSCPLSSGHVRAIFLPGYYFVETTPILVAVSSWSHDPQKCVWGILPGKMDGGTDGQVPRLHLVSAGGTHGSRTIGWFA